MHGWMDGEGGSRGCVVVEREGVGFWREEGRGRKEERGGEGGGEGGGGGGMGT